jgi:hypothetical protein
VYFFEDDDGRVRMIDTSSTGSGKSAPLALPSVPNTAAYVESAFAGVPLLVACAAGDERPPHGRAALFEVMPEGRVRAVGEVDKLARVYVADHRSLSTGLGKIELGFAFFDGGALVVRPPGSSTWKRAALPDGFDPEHTIVTWPNKDSFLVVDKRTAKTAAVAVDDARSFGAGFARMTSMKVPVGLASVDAVATWDAQKASVLVGKTVDGRVAVTMLTPAPSKELVILEDGAVFRGLRPAPDAAGNNVVGRFAVDYTLPGDPVEPEHYRQRVVDLFDSLGL